MAASRRNDSAAVYFQRGSCKIILKQGDLFNESDVDVIVIPTPEGGQQTDHNYPLFEKLRSRVTPETKSDIKRLSSKIERNGSPQLISSDKPSIILTPTPYFGNTQAAFKMLRTTYVTCLKFAVQHNFQTIAFPTIGCGASGFEGADAADVLHKALTTIEEAQMKKLNEIRIVIFDMNIFAEFMDIFTNRSKLHNAQIKSIEISSGDSKSTAMPSRSDKKEALRQQPQRSDAKQESSSDSDEDKIIHRQDHMRRQTSKFNPEAAEFQPTNNNQRRTPRRYRLSNNQTELIILQGDILQTKVDAIVNAANEEMLGGGGVDGIIHKAAGSELFKSCKAHKKIYPDVRLPTGRSRILLSYNMSPMTYYIINTSGPRYDDAPPQQCEEQLISCYKTSLALANLYDLETIAFTAISCGIFGYPIDEAAETALQTVDKEADSMRQILFVLKDDHIYDAWVRKADELKFNSLDGNSVVTSNPSTSSSDHKKSTISKTNQKDELETKEKSTKLKVTDLSTSNDTQTADQSITEKPPETTDKFPNQLPADNKENDHASNSDTDTQSDKQTNDNRREKKSPDNSTNQTRGHGQSNKKPPIDSKNSGNPSGVGRGRGNTTRK